MGTNTFHNRPLFCAQLPTLCDQISASQLLCAAARPAPHRPPISACENEADRLMLELYREIYSGRLDNLQMFLLKEFFEILEKAIDRCREAGVVVYQIVLKNS